MFWILIFFSFTGMLDLIEKDTLALFWETT